MFKKRLSSILVLSIAILAMGYNVWASGGQSLSSYITSVTSPLSVSSGNLSVASGYSIPLTASSTLWQSFYITPSTRITAGDYIDWTGNTLNVSGTGLVKYGAANRLAYYSAAGTTATGTTDLVWDESTNSLGIGTSTMTQELNIQGDVYSSGSYYGDGSNLTGVGSAAASALTFTAKAKVTVKKGQAVYVAGGASALPDVALADNTTTNKSRVIGIAAADAATSSNVLIRRAGELTTVDTRTTNTYINPGAETWAEGDLLFLTTNGGLTKTRPTSGRSVKVAYSLKGSGNTDTLMAYPMENPVWSTCAANESVVLRAGDSSGSYGVSIRDYTNNVVAFINSDGAASFATTTRTTGAELDVYGDIILSGASRYLNFNLLNGTSGYGLRDNAGTMEYKNSGGSWTSLAAAGGGGGGGYLLYDGGNDFYYVATTSSTFAFGSTSDPTSKVNIVGSSTDGFLSVTKTTLGDQFIVDEKGYCGIGTTTPVEELSITGDLWFTGAVKSGTWNGTKVDISDYTNLTAGDHITLTGDDLDVDDDYLLNNGDIGTGVYDFGGATSVEIPNGSAVYTNTTGNIAIDTSSGQLRYGNGSATSTLVGDFDKSFYIASTTTDKDYNKFNTASTTFELWNPKRAVTLTDLYCKTNDDTVFLECGDGTNKTEIIVCDNDGQEDDSSITNGAFTARENFVCTVKEVSGSPDAVWVTATFAYTID